MPKWCDAKVVRKQIWTEGLFTISIAAQGLIPHKPGQFLHLALPIEDDKIVNRPYSVASPAGDQVEFFIVMVEEGQLTPRLWVADGGVTTFSFPNDPPADSHWITRQNQKSSG